MPLDGLVSSSGFRGLALKEITPELCLRLGLALSGLLGGTCVVGRDVRLSSPLLAQSLIDGLNSGGSDTVFLGLAPTPAVSFYSRRHSGGAMVTASHNPPPYNGIKLFDGRGASVTQGFYEGLLSAAAREPRYSSWDALGSSKAGGGLHDYVDHVASAFAGKRWRVGLDPGNGATAVTAPAVFSAIDCDASAVNLAPDGTFPGRGSEPGEGALSSLSELVRERGLDAGFAYDGDGDRLAIVDERGEPVPQDVALAFAASQIVREKGGSVVVNVDTSAMVDIMVEEAGGKVYRSRVGDPYVVEEMIRRGSVFGGESCGAWIYPDQGLCPDGVLSSILFLSLLSGAGVMPSQLRGMAPRLSISRLKVGCPNGLKARVMASLGERIGYLYPESEILLTDGIRAGLPDKSWVLVRPSGTEPLIRITAEALDRHASQDLAGRAEAAVREIVDTFKPGDKAR